jgi:hypothetical protein
MPRRFDRNIKRIELLGRRQKGGQRHKNWYGDQSR